MFAIQLADQNGDGDHVLYDPHTSALTDKDGNSIIERSLFASFDYSNTPDAIRVTPDQPGNKSRHISRLKIQLGLSCNYTCSYCLQGAHVQSATKTSTRDAELFLKRLESWLHYPEEVTRIELWGGEPLLYWNKFKLLVPELQKRCPNASFGIITNGSLLDDEIMKKLFDWGFSMGISHDGPGQHIRGPDPLEDKEIRATWQRAINLFGPRLSINSVISPANHSVIANAEWFNARLQDVNLSYEGVVHDYDGDVNSQFTKEQLQLLTEELISCMLGPEELRKPFVGKLKRTLDTFVNQRPSRVVGQKCGMDRADAISVDLLGNVSTCQNTATVGHHRIGSVQDFDNIKLDTATHWAHRPECSVCPVLQLCAGSCMYQEGEGWFNSCRAEYAYNMAFLVAAMFVITGKRVVGITKQ